MNDEIVKDDVALDRKELLSQQFDNIEAPVVEEKQVARDAGGKFATAVVSEPVVEEPVWKRPPASWKSEYHQDWNTASPRIQEYAWNREQQMREGIEPMVSKAQYADEMQKIISPYINTIQGLGLTASQAVDNLLKADNVLRNGSPQEKEDYLVSLRQQYGMSAVEGQTPQTDVVYLLRNELNSLKGEIHNFKQDQENSAQQVLNKEIESFSMKKEHFEEARPAMIQLLQGGMANNLEEAYEKAIRLDARLSENLWKAPQADIQTKVNLADKAAKSAKAAAVSVKSSTPGVSTMTKAQDRRSLLSEQFDQISERF